MERILTLILALSVLVSPAAVAGPPVVTPSGVELERIADYTALPPGIQGEFIIFLSAPVPCNGGVLFEGSGSVAVGGDVYFATPAGVEVIANPGVPVPGTAETFQDSKEPVCLGDRILFLGDHDVTPSGTGRSVYMASHGVITPVLQEGIVLGSETVRSFTQLSANEFGVGTVVSVIPPSPSRSLVIKPHDGDPFIIADRTTILPGQTEPATIYSIPLMVGPDLVFHARTYLDLGIYRWFEGQGLSVLVDTNTPVPAPPGGNFGIFDLQFASLDYGIVFGAIYAGGHGLFVWNHGQVQPLVLPGHVGADGETLTAAFRPSGAGSLLSFKARTVEDPLEAIYVRTRDGAVKRILGVGETIEGLVVSQINAGANHSSVAIVADPTGIPSGRRILYQTLFADPLDVPVLSRSGVVALVLGLTLAGLWALRRRPVVRWRARCAARTTATAISD